MRFQQVSRGKQLGNHRGRVLAFQRQPRPFVGRHRVHCRGQKVQQELHGKEKRAHPALDDGEGAARCRHDEQQVSRR